MIVKEGKNDSIHLQILFTIFTHSLYWQQSHIKPNFIYSLFKVRFFSFDISFPFLSSLVLLLAGSLLSDLFLLISCLLNLLPNTLPWLSGYTSAIFRLPGQIYIMKCCCENWVNYFCSIRVIFPIYFMRSSCKTPTCCVKNTHKN